MALFMLHMPQTLDPATQPAAEKLVSVKEGFHFFAFVFPLPWLLLHRLWLWSLLFFIATLSLIAAAKFLGVSQFFATLVIIFLNLFIGLEAGELRVQKLARRGYRQVGIIAAKTREEAELRYFATRYPAATTSS